MNRKEKGFTLVELLLAVAMIMLLVGVGAISLNEFNARQKVNTAKEDLITNLRLARNYATSMQLPSGLTGGLKEVDVDVLNTGITITAINSEDERKIYFSKSIFPKEVEIIKIIPSDAIIKFSSYKGSSIGSNGDIEITLSTDVDADNIGAKVGSTAVVVIKNSGLINEK
jgi:Tfp pilus assembly protein FimT